MIAVIDILVTNRFVVCCDTYILIADTKQYDNIQNKTAKKKSAIWKYWKVNDIWTTKKVNDI